MATREAETAQLEERRQRRRRLSLGQRQNVLSYTLLAPSLLLTLVFIAFPLYTILNLSFREGSTMIMAEVGDLPVSTENYRAVFTNSETWASLRISATYSAATVLGALTLGMATALILNRRLPGRRWIRTLLLLPWPIPGAIATVAFVWMLDGTYGVINFMLHRLGIITEYIPWFFNPQTALAGVLMPTIWIAYPMCTLLLLASLQSVPKDLYESAHVDGASPVQQFRFITWPAVKATAVLAMIVTGLWSFTTFDFIYAITRGGPNRATETLAVAIYNEAFRFFNLPYASALGVVTMGFAAIVLILLFPVIRKRFF